MGCPGVTCVGTSRGDLCGDCEVWVEAGKEAWKQA